MTPVWQRYRHRPPETYGDCHRAAMASILDLPLDAVPHFMDGLADDDGPTFNRRQDDFLRTRGLACVVFPCQGEVGIVLRAVSLWNPNLLFLLGGVSSTGHGHSVVANGSGIVHDPSPDGIGVVGPMADGYYWITYLVGRLPCTEVEHGRTASIPKEL